MQLAFILTTHLRSRRGGERERGERASSCSRAAVAALPARPAQLERQIGREEGMIIASSVGSSPPLARSQQFAALGELERGAHGRMRGRTPAVFFSSFARSLAQARSQNASERRVRVITMAQSIVRARICAGALRALDDFLLSCFFAFFSDAPRPHLAQNASAAAMPPRS